MVLKSYVFFAVVAECLNLKKIWSITLTLMSFVYGIKVISDSTLCYVEECVISYGKSNWKRYNI
jgi:hypothetical protein